MVILLYMVIYGIVYGGNLVDDGAEICLVQTAFFCW